MKVLSAEQTRMLEKAAVNMGMPYIQLMENAGAATARFICKRFPVEQKRVVALCGKGNNGGDGFVAARYLAEQGAMVIVVLVEGEPVTEDAASMLEQLRLTAAKVVNYEEAPEIIAPMIASADLVLDAIYGIGFHGSVPESLSPLFIIMKSCSATVIAVDVPSGVVCDTGAVEGKCIHANHTVTFTTLKNAHLLQPGKECCGQVAVVPVGIEAALVDRQTSSLEVLELENARAMLRPRQSESNKGSYGRLLCVCGSAGMAGAAIMSLRAALRCGVGLIEAALPASIYSIVAAQAVEPVYIPLRAQPDGALTPASERLLLSALQKSSACLIGCGLGKSGASASLVKALLASSGVPVILDADGINIVAEHIDYLKAAQAPIVLTPHPGEMARLSGAAVAKVQAHRLQTARDFAAQYGVTIVLKGAGTIIVEAGGKAYLNTTGNPGMAKAGSGDVLAGMIASFIAQGIAPAAAAAGCVYLHGLAGDRCAQRLSQCAMLPTDMLEELPALFLDLER